VRAVVRHSDDIRAWMEEPWRHRSFPGPERYQYAAPSGEYVPEADAGTGITGSDPALVSRELIERQGVGTAVLLPGMRGLLPNVDLDAELCSATNRWLSETWLGEGNEHGRFRGTIRVAAGDPVRAVREIERWAGDESIVQVAVPMQSHQPYGQRRYLPIWEAAAEAGLPVAIHIDGGASVDFHPTPAGYVRYAVEYATMYPMNFAFHLASFIAEGVFDRIDDLKVVFTDGGFDLLAPLIWRLDKDWRPTREDFPWTASLPSEYLQKHVRFCSNGLEGPLDGEGWERWLQLSDAETLLMFASNYPQRDYDAPSTAFDGLAEPLRRRIMGDNARELYRL
jgi:predicted TIM-barrel fold metal-dependent hydrolase